MKKINLMRGSAVLLAAISLMMLGTALILAQATAVKSDTKATIYSTDQNLAQAAAAIAAAAGQTYINSFTAGTPPATCSSSGCTTVYSATALAGGADAQSRTWWTTSANVKTTNIGTSCSALSDAGNIACAYAIEQASCSTTTGGIAYTITGYGYFTGTGTFSSKITTSRASSSLTKTAFAAANTSAVTYVNPTGTGTPTSLCPLKDLYWSSSGCTSNCSFIQNYMALISLKSAAAITLNSALANSTFASGSGTITTVGLAGGGGCSSMTVTVKNNTTNQTVTTGAYAIGGSVSTDGCNTTYGGNQGWTLKTRALSSALPITYGDSITFSATASSCIVALATYNGNTTQTTSTYTTRASPFPSGNSTDSTRLIYSLTGIATSGYTCP